MARKAEAEKSPATNDAYTGMLGISLVALLVGCALLYLDYSQYPDKAPKGPGLPPPPVVKTDPGGAQPPPAPPQNPPVDPKKQ
jgi:hypothetical protein